VSIAENNAASRKMDADSAQPVRFFAVPIPNEPRLKRLRGGCTLRCAFSAGIAEYLENGPVVSIGSDMPFRMPLDSYGKSQAALDRGVRHLREYRQDQQQPLGRGDDGLGIF
jgi:hypothetical protein